MVSLIFPSLKDKMRTFKDDSIKVSKRAQTAKGGNRLGVIVEEEQKRRT